MKKFNYIKWLTEHKHGLEEKVKPGSEKQDKLPDGRTVTRYTAVSPKGKETPMISYDDNLEGPGDNKDPKPPVDKPDEKKDDEKTDDPKKFPFIGPKDKEFEVKLFDISPEATKLYTILQNETFKDNVEMLGILRSAAIQHERLFVIEKIALDDKSASKAQVKCAEEIILIIDKRARELGKENEHNYLQARIDSIKKIHQEKPREDKDGDCPDSKDIENDKDKITDKFKIDKTSTTYGPSNPAPVYREGMSDEEWADAKEKERLNKHPEKDKINKIKQMMAKERGELSQDEVMTIYNNFMDTHKYKETVINDPDGTKENATLRIDTEDGKSYEVLTSAVGDEKWWEWGSGPYSAEQAEYDKGWYGESLKEAATKLGYLNESYNSITLHTDEGLYQEEKSNLEDLKSYPFPTGAEITVPALGSAKFANNIETREKTEDPSTRFGIDYYLNEFEKEYGSTEFEVSKDLGNRYTLTPINNPKFDAAYETDRQKQIDRREKGPGWQRSDNMGNKTDKWS